MSPISIRTALAGRGTLLGMSLAFPANPFHLFLVRHGECVSNTLMNRGAISDAEDVLTPRGRQQADCAGEALPGLWRPGTVLVSSSLTRARQTTEQILHHLPGAGAIIHDERLIEKSDDEPFEQAAARALASIAEHGLGGRLVCVTHGHIIGALVALALGIPMPARFYPLHGAISYIRGGELTGLNMALHLAHVSSHDLW